MPAFASAAAETLEELQRVTAEVDDAEVDFLCDAIEAAHTIVIGGVGREGYAAEAFAMRLFHLGLDAHWVWDATAPAVGTGDLAVIVNGTGRVAHLKAVADQIHHTGCRIAVVGAVDHDESMSGDDVYVRMPARVRGSSSKTVPSHHPMGTLFELSIALMFDEVVLMLADRLGVSASDMEARHRNFE